jgi:hypothetical protein
MKTSTAVPLVLLVLTQAADAQETTADASRWSGRVQTVLEVTKPLEFAREGRLPLYLWPAMNPGDLDDQTTEHLVAELDRRGIGLISSWSP